MSNLACFCLLIIVQVYPRETLGLPLSVKSVIACHPCFLLSRLTPSPYVSGSANLAVSGSLNNWVKRAVSLLQPVEFLVPSMVGRQAFFSTCLRERTPATTEGTASSSSGNGPHIEDSFGRKVAAIPNNLSSNKKTVMKISSH